MKFAIPRETFPGETRVAMVPETVKLLVKKGHQVAVQSGAGEAAFIPDSEYAAADAKIVNDTRSLYQDADCILKVRAPSKDELAQIPEGKALISFIWHLSNPDLVKDLNRKKLTTFSMDAVPRITRAQSMDALSSMSTVAGYKAVLLATDFLPKFIPMLTTAAGTVRPSNVLILGAGVAGLQAIATARRLGAVVTAFDPRPATKEQVLSLGAKFIDFVFDAKEAEGTGGYAKEQSDAFLKSEQEAIRKVSKDSDIIITTALIPGKPAPKLITAEMIREMKPGSVIIDLAAEAGGNTELTKPNETVRIDNVTIAGPTNLPGSMPLDASRMYARNMATFIQEITTDKGFTWNWENEIFKKTCITHEKTWGGA